MLTISNCAVINPDVRYAPRTENEFIFPMHSQEFTKSVEECMKLEKFPCNYPEPLRWS